MPKKANTGAAATGAAKAKAPAKVEKAKSPANEKAKAVAMKLIKENKLTYNAIHDQLKADVEGFDKSVSWVKNLAFNYRHSKEGKADAKAAATKD